MLIGNSFQRRMAFDVIPLEMPLNQYIVETEPAVRGLLDLIGREQQRLSDAQESHFSMDTEARRLFDCMKRTGSDSTLWVELAGFEKAKERFAAEIVTLNKLMTTLGPTYNSLAGAVLQIAKQGISATHGGLASCPNGRIVGSTEPIKNIIWQARNQSMHYEESNYHNNVQSCFANLVSDFGSYLNLGNTNHALAILDLLGWAEYNTYESDIATLLPP